MQKMSEIRRPLVQPPPCGPHGTVDLDGQADYNIPVSWYGRGCGKTVVFWPIRLCERALF